MAKVRRECSVCKTKKFRKDSGVLVCKYGHQVLDYQVEEGDDEKVTGKERKRARVIKNIEDHGYTPHEQKSNWLRICYFTLKVMTRCMVQELGFSKDLEATVKKLWLLYISNSQTELADAYMFGLDDDSNGNITTTTADQSTQEEAGNILDDDVDVPEVLLDESETESESESENEMEIAVESALVERVPSDPMLEWLDLLKMKKEKMQWKTGLKWPNVSFIDSLVFLYLACIWLRYPVVAGDFVRWSKTGQLPYLDMQRRIPHDILSYTGSIAHQMTIIPNATFLLEKARIYAFCFKRLCKVNFPPLNIPLLLNRFCDQYYLPVTGYYYARYIYQLAALKHKDDFARQSKDRASTVLLACVLVTAKLFYGVTLGPNQMDLVCSYNPQLTKRDWALKIKANLKRWKDMDASLSVARSMKMFRQASVRKSLIAHHADKQFLVVNVLKRNMDDKPELVNRQNTEMAALQTDYDIWMVAERSFSEQSRLFESVSSFKNILRELERDEDEEMEATEHTVVEVEALPSSQPSSLPSDATNSQPTPTEEQPSESSLAIAIREESHPEPARRALTIGEMFYTRNEKVAGHPPSIYLDLLNLGHFILTCEQYDCGLEKRLRLTDKKLMHKCKPEPISKCKLFRFYN